jgi:hypothetical protein
MLIDLVFGFIGKILPKKITIGSFQVTQIMG